MSQKRNKYLLAKYGITNEIYQELLEEQALCCAVCRRRPKQGINLCVDHDHVTGRIRGLLCRYCNKMVIGRHRDPDLFSSAARYLRGGTDYYVPKAKKRKRNNKRRKRKDS